MRPTAVGPEAFAVALELGPRRRVFAQAVDWIGWCRSGRDEARALAALLAYALRFAVLAERVGLHLAVPAGAEAFVVRERVRGGAVTDFGALSCLFAGDLGPVDDSALDRLARLLAACWAAFDDALAPVPEALRAVKPKTGRSPAAMRLHLLETDRMHLAAFGTAFRAPDPAAVDEQESATRTAILDGLGGLPRGEPFTPRRRYGFAWTPLFAVRRAAWHALDHAWELEDRTAR